MCIRDSNSSAYVSIDFDHFYLLSHVFLWWPSAAVMWGFVRFAPAGALITLLKNLAKSRGLSCKNPAKFEHLCCALHRHKTLQSFFCSNLCSFFCHTRNKGKKVLTFATKNYISETIHTTTNLMESASYIPTYLCISLLFTLAEPGFSKREMNKTNGNYSCISSDD